MGDGTWHRVAARGDVHPDAPVQVKVGENLIALYDIDGAVYATSDICTHAFACLSEGFQEGDMIECPLHEGRFHIPTGKAQGAPVTVDLKVYPVKVDGDDILVEVES